MPETTPYSEVKNIGVHLNSVRELLELNPQNFETIQLHLGLTPPQTRTVLQRLEHQQEIYCRSRVWRLVD